MSTLQWYVRRARRLFDPARSQSENDIAVATWLERRGHSHMVRRAKAWTNPLKVLLRVGVSSAFGVLKV